MAQAAARRGVAAAVLLMVLAMAVPAVFGWQVRAEHFAPLASSWRPRFGPGTVPALALGVAAAMSGPRLAASLSWPRLLLAAFAAGVAWLAALATVDGWHGISGPLELPSEYLGTARQVTDVSALLHEYVDRIPPDVPQSWPTHVAGHPPGALLFFVGLDRLGLGSGLAAGWAVLLIGSSTPVAVLLTLRRLGAVAAARRVAPLLVFGPAAIWTAVSADAMFAAVAAWALMCVAAAATAQSGAAVTGWSLLAGVLLGSCVLLSYGLPLLGVLVLGVLVIARSARPLPGLVVGCAAVVLGFAAAGFAWWRALGPLRERYYAGIAGDRPAGYWLWGDVAALCFSAGPVVGASLAVVIARRRVRSPDERAAVLLTGAAAACVALADLSLMSKAEVERIWLPFVPWLLLGLALLPEHWRRRALAAQVGFAIVVQSLLATHW